MENEDLAQAPAEESAPKKVTKKTKKAPAISYDELVEARTEMENAHDEAIYWRRSLQAANAINTLTHKAARVAEVEAELEDASTRYAEAYAKFHDLKLKAAS